MGNKFKSLGNLLNGWTDWHQIWHTCAYSSGNGYTPNKLPLETQGGFLADSSRNGHRLNTIRPSILQGISGGGGLGGHKFKCFGKLSNGWTD